MARVEVCRRQSRQRDALSPRSAKESKEIQRAAKSSDGRRWHERGQGKSPNQVLMQGENGWKPVRGRKARGQARRIQLARCLRMRSWAKSTRALSGRASQRERPWGARSGASLVGSSATFNRVGANPSAQYIPDASWRAHDCPRSGCKDLLEDLPFIEAASETEESKRRSRRLSARSALLLFRSASSPRNSKRLMCSGLRHF